jgi:hypothetical protein
MFLLGLFSLLLIPVHILAKRYRQYTWVDYMFDPKFDYRFIFIDAIDKYIAKCGSRRNKPCGWSTDKIFRMIRRMDLYDEDTLEIPNNKFYWICPYDRKWTDEYKGGWSSMIGHTIPTINAINILTNYLKDKRTLSVGSGMGLWEYLLERNGCDIICVDINDTNVFTYTNIIKVNGDNIIDELVSRKKITDPHDINVLFLGWPEPNVFCNCCKTEICANGYDAETLNCFKGDCVVFIHCDYAEEGINHVGSVKCRQILEKDYERVEHIKLPYNMEDEVVPFADVYIRKIEK